MNYDRALAEPGGDPGVAADCGKPTLDRAHGKATIAFTQSPSDQALGYAGHGVCTLVSTSGPGDFAGRRGAAERQPRQPRHERPGTDGQPTRLAHTATVWDADIRSNRVFPDPSRVRLRAGFGHPPVSSPGGDSDEARLDHSRFVFERRYFLLVRGARASRKVTSRPRSSSHSFNLTHLRPSHNDSRGTC